MMASLTYCCTRIGSSSTGYHRRSRSFCCGSSRRRSHHVKQIALLIITFVVYVSGIRNSATSNPQLHFQNGNGNEFAAGFNGYQQQQQQQQQHQQSASINYQPMMPSNYEFQRPITPPPPPSSSQPLPTLTAPTDASTSTTTTTTSTMQTYFNENQAKISHQKEFRPSEQIFEFTLSDATPVTPNYPPSYLSTNYNTATANNNIFHNQRQPEMANKRYHQEENTQFAFPTETMSHIFGSSNNGPTTLPTPQLQTTPINTYKDPYTNEKYQAVQRPPTTALVQQFKGHIAGNGNVVDDDDDANLIYYGNQNYQGDIGQEQAYTVQSSLLVGSSGNGGQSNSNRVDSYRPLSSPNNEYKRPGYVFDEQIRPNYISSNSNGNSDSNKFKQQHQYTGNRKPMPPQSLSYDSHDYPPPSYYQRPAYLQQQEHQQQSTYFQSPQRQDIGLQPISQASTHTISYQPATPSSSSSSTSSSNYANNFGNYLLAADAQHPHQYQQQQQQHQQQRYPPPPPPPHPQQAHQYATQGNYYPNQQRPPPSPSNYYEYQLGEIPPQRRPPPPPPPSFNNNPNYGPQRPSQPTGLASLASLFTTTQQYAPQFTNLLLGAITGGGGGGGSGAASLLRPQQQRPLNMQLIKALENIARNDDLQCVPKVLCQTIAGQTQRGQLPSFITSPAITNFLSGFPVASPALIYGRAALLGISGGERSCAQTYEQCPKNEYEILHYLNNHRGGFFKFFSEPEEQATTNNNNGNYDDNSVGGGGGGGGFSSSLFSILTALTGNPAPAPPKRITTTTTTTQRPATTLDLGGGIGNFFSQVLSDYLSGVEYQRRRRRRSLETEIKVDAIEPETDVAETKILNDEDFHDEEDNEDTENDEALEEVEAAENTEQQYADAEARILHKDEIHAEYPKFFPQEDRPMATLSDAVKIFNAEKAVRKLKFPSSQVDDRDPGKLGVSWVSFEDVSGEGSDQQVGASTFKSKRRGKKVNDHGQYTGANSQGSQRIIFPDHYEQHIRKGRILNRPDYAASYGDYVRATAADEDRFVLANNHRRPHYQDYEQPLNSLSGEYYATTSSHYASSSSSSLSSSSAAYGGHGAGGFSNRFNSQETGFRPTPLPSSSGGGVKAQRYTTNFNNNGYNGLRGSGSSSSSSTSGGYSSSNSASGYSQYHNYNYPNNNYVSNNRYSSNYQAPRTTTTTRRPREHDPNVYVTNGHGVNEYYITPDGRKIYQRSLRVV